MEVLTMFRVKVCIMGIYIDNGWVGGLGPILNSSAAPFLVGNAKRSQLGRGDRGPLQTKHGRTQHTAGESVLEGKSSEARFLDPLGPPRGEV